MAENIYVSMTVAQWRQRILQSMEEARRAAQDAEKTREENLALGQAEMPRLYQDVLAARSKIFPPFRPHRPALVEELCFLAIDLSERLDYAALVDRYPHLELFTRGDMKLAFICSVNSVADLHRLDQVNDHWQEIKDFLIEFESTVGEQGLGEEDTLRLPFSRISLLQPPFTIEVVG